MLRDSSASLSVVEVGLTVLTHDGGGGSAGGGGVGGVFSGGGSDTPGQRGATPTHRHRTATAALYSGCVRLPFSSLLHLRDGVVTLPFLPPGADPFITTRAQKHLPAYLRGSLTLRVTFVYPLWDDVKPIVPTVVARRIRIISADNLPLVTSFVHPS